MNRRWIDTHCHLDAPEFGSDVVAVRARARAQGVAHCVLPAVEVAGFDAVRRLAHEFGDSYALGIHPLYVKQASDADLAQLDAALTVHRDGLRSLGNGSPWLGIAHAFNGSLQQAQAFIGLGLKLGFGGALTYERAQNLRRLAKELPLEAIVLETDAPDMPPHWLYRTAQQREAGLPQGRNEPGPRCWLGCAGLMLRHWRQLPRAMLAMPCRACCQRRNVGAKLAVSSLRGKGSTALALAR